MTHIFATCLPDHHDVTSNQAEERVSAERRERLALYLTRMLLLRKDTAAFPLQSTGRSACSCRSAGGGNAPRPITSVFTPSPVTQAACRIFSGGKVGYDSHSTYFQLPITFH